MKLDIIIIGSGLGGLTAGAKLAKEGKKVLLFEQHYIVGGCATTFRRKGLTVEVGLHEMDGLDQADPKLKIFNELGVFNEVEFVKAPELYRFINGRVDIVIPDNVDKAIKILVERFPDEEKGIKKFFKTVLDIHREVNKLPDNNWKITLPLFPFQYPNLFSNRDKTVGDFLDSIIKDEDLKLVLIANIGYYHDDPHTMSLLFYSTAQGSYYTGGGHYIKGGSQKLSNYLAKTITDKGGKILVGHLVTEIITENSKAVGVKYKKIIGKNNEEQRVYANILVANVSIPQVAYDLLPSMQDNKLKTQIEQFEIACSLLSIYLGLRKSPKKIGNRHYSTFVFDESIKKLSQFIDNVKDPEYSKKGFVFVDYSQIDSGLTSSNMSLGVIVTIDYISNWENLSQDEYTAKKEEVAQIYIDKLERLIPGIKKEIQYYEVGTPKTIIRYTKNPKGTPYGFAQTPQQAGLKRLTYQSPIKNLFFASAWTRPGGGFTAAILSGYNCAKAILKKIK